MPKSPDRPQPEVAKFATPPFQTHSSQELRIATLETQIDLLSQRLAIAETQLQVALQRLNLLPQNHQ